MKTNIFVATLLLFFIGCTPQQSDQLTQQQKDQIKAEVKASCDSMWVKWERLDAVATMGYVSDSPDFVAYNPDGSRVDFEGFKKMVMGMVGTLAAVKLAPLREDVYVLAKDAAVYAWFGKSEIVMNSGEKITYEPDAETFVLNKVAGHWKIVYAHESATIVTQKVGKK